MSLPTFFTGLLLVYVFYYLIGIAPAPLGRLDVYSSAPPDHTGFYLIDSLLAGDFETFRAALAQLILPASTMAIFTLAPLARITRAAMLAAFGSEFVRTAKASGLARGRVVFVYAFRNAVLPVITTLGMVFSFLLGANVLVEKVFAWPGIGSYAVDAVIASDYAPVQGFVLTMALLYVLLNLLVDLAYGFVDPAGAARSMTATGAPCRICAGGKPGDRLRLCVVLRCSCCAPHWGHGSCPMTRWPATPPPALTGPSAAHWFGTDQLGRDIFSRIVVATRLDLGIAITSVALAFGIGTLAGLAAGYFGGWIDRIVGRAVDTIMAFPLFVLAMGIVAALGNNVANIVYATAIINLPIYARLARAEANVRRNAGFVEAARLCGNGRGAHRAWRNLLPNIMPLMMVQVSLTLGYAILNAAGLSFIGLGVRPPTAEWGIMVAEGASFIISGEWWVALFPGLVLMAAVFCFNLMGDGSARHRRPAAADMMSGSNALPLLAVDDLSVEFRTRSGTVHALDRVGFELHRGETMALVGESGSGKSVTAYAIMGILDAGGTHHLGADHVRRSGSAADRRKGDRRNTRARTGDHLSEPAHRAQSDPPGRSADRRYSAAARQRHRGRRHQGAPSTCWRKCAFPIRSGAPDPIRSSCRAGCVSGS